MNSKFRIQNSELILFCRDTFHDSRFFSRDRASERQFRRHDSDNEINCMMWHVIRRHSNWRREIRSELVDNWWKDKKILMLNCASLNWRSTLEVTIEIFYRFLNLKCYWHIILVVRSRRSLIFEISDVVLIENHLSHVEEDWREK